MISLTLGFFLCVLILFILTLLVCAVGFKKFVYFISIGYGFSIVAIGITLIIFGILKPEFTNITKTPAINYILATLLILYGCRLSFFLLIREHKSKSYKKVFNQIVDESKDKMGVFVKIMIWISVCILYILQTYPIIFRFASSKEESNTSIIVPIVGGVIAFLGLVLEMSADLQKTYYKKKENTFVSKGLYKYVRCPNYLGEIIFWTGIFVTGTSIFKTDAIAWICSILGYLLIVYVMLNGAKRLEKRQLKSYGNDPLFIEYINKTPILSRLIPVKSLIKYKWIK